MTALLLAFLAAGPALAAARPERPEVAVSPRLELLAVVHALAAEGKPLRGFSFNRTDYAQAARGRFGSFRGHRAVRLYRQAAGSGLDFVSAFRLVMEQRAAAPPAGPAPPAAAGPGMGPGGPGQGSVFGPAGPGPGSVHLSSAQAELLAALEDFRRETGFDAFLESQKSRLDGYAAAAAAQKAGRDYVGMLEEYTGEKSPADYTLLVCPLCEEPEGANLVQAGGGRARVLTTLGPVSVARGAPVFDFAEARLGIWHELGHTLLDPLQAARGEELRATAPLFEAVADCCRGSWEDCVREHAAQGLAYAVWEWTRRTGRVEDGPRKLRQKKEPPYVREVAARFREFEAGRASGLTLDAFYPRLFDVFSELLAAQKGKPARNGACRAGTRF